MPINILNPIIGFLSPQITKDKKLNPVHLALGIRGYWIQSQVLHIPDRFGFFSPGPPRLQVHQAFLLLPMLLAVITTSFWGAFAICLAVLNNKDNSLPAWRITEVVVVLVVGGADVLYIGFLFDPCLAQNYDWVDWKVHKD